jgi:cytoskeletal protein CcmA (bactofilin family)
MKITFKFIAITLLLALMLLPALPASAQGLGSGSPGGKIIFGDNFVLEAGETLSGDLVIFGGNVTLESGSTVTGSMAVIGGNVTGAEDVTVTGDLVMMGGNLSMDGKLNGNMVLVGGQAALGDAAIVGGDITTVGGNLERAPGAQIMGQIQDNSSAPSINIPGIPPVGSLPATPVVPVPLPNTKINFNPLSGLLGTVGWAIAVSLIAVIASLFLQPQMERVSSAITSQPLITSSFGLITVAASLLVFLIMAITIILIPVSGLGLVILLLAWLFGLVALGHEVGDRLAQQLKQSWTIPLSAGLGTLLLMLVVGSLVSLVPCVGVLAAMLVGLAGLGGVVLTRFGSRSFPLPGIVPMETPPAS